MNNTPDDVVYDDDAVCDQDWRTCWCEECQGLREDYADMKYQQMKDEEFDK